VKQDGEHTEQCWHIFICDLLVRDLMQLWWRQTLMLLRLMSPVGHSPPGCCIFTFFRTTSRTSSMHLSMEQRTDVDLFLIRARSMPSQVFIHGLLPQYPVPSLNQCYASASDVLCHHMVISYTLNFLLCSAFRVNVSIMYTRQLELLETDTFSLLSTDVPCTPNFIQGSDNSDSYFNSLKDKSAD